MVESPSSQKIGDLDAQRLELDLVRSVAGEVRFDTGSRALYSTDSSNYRQIPIGVVVPRTLADVEATVGACREHRAPLLVRGGGTSLAGQTCNTAVVIDTSKYLNRILEVDPDRRLARVEPGVVLDDLRSAAEVHNLTFGPDPATHDRCTLGGMIGNNSCGVHSVMAGKTDENVLALDVLTYHGLRLDVGATSDAALQSIVATGGSRARIYQALADLRDTYADHIRSGFPQIPRRVSGYNLPYLLPENVFNLAGALVGSESTCVLILGATLQLVHSPPHRSLVVLGYPDIYTAADAVPELLDFDPIGLEALDDRMITNMERLQLYREEIAALPEAGAWLMVEFGASTHGEAQSIAQRMMHKVSRSSVRPTMKLCRSAHEAARYWKVRQSGLGATSVVPGSPEFWSGWEDSAVAPDRMGEYLRDLRSLVNSYGYGGAFYGHFGDGCLHARFDFDLTTRDGIAKYRAFVTEAADLVVSYGGSLSGEHGDGQSRGELLPKMFNPELMSAFRAFKRIWDPDNKMNPGKVVDANALDSGLRLGSAYSPPRLKTHFAFAEDGGSFAAATLRCVGVGRCRRTNEATMCPSYMVTKEEKDSTRGRAHLLFEMVRGSTLKEGWRSEAVREALDLCLACKGCKSECPVSVDMATYKAEFLSHYYARRVRPRSAYTMGLIYWWSRLAALAPETVNRAAHAPILSNVLKCAAGVALERDLPAFASQTFRSSFSAAGGRASISQTRNADGDVASQPIKVLLWPDTFNNHFHPETAHAAVEVLEGAGFSVSIPSARLCCGRPLYDYGMLDLATHLLRKVVASLRHDIRAGTPLVVLEPSCAAVFRDELVRLLPDDPDALRLRAQTFLLSELLERYAPDFRWPALDRSAVVHGHCHQTSLMGMSAELSLLEKAGVDVVMPDAGCCGMAGAFGFERDHYDVSVKCADRVLLPEVRRAPDATLIIADGFSCREQIRQLGGRRTWHLAEILQSSLSPRAQ
jgi:FAD/FMN-containing dehydrogenase/Fe-S oxidoreductase